VYASFYASWIKGSMCIKVPKVVILDVGRYERMSANLFVLPFNGIVVKAPSICNARFVVAYSGPANIVVVGDLRG
jgi:hypothetical protein